MSSAPFDLYGSSLDDVSFFSFDEYAQSPAKPIPTIVIMDVSSADMFDTMLPDNNFFRCMGIATQVNLTLAAFTAKKCSKPGADKGSSFSCIMLGETESDEDAFSFTVCMLPTACSRNNTPSRAHSVGAFVKSHRGSGDVRVVLVTHDRSYIVAQALSVAREFPHYNEKHAHRKKVGSGAKKNQIDVIVDLPLGDPALEEIRSLANGVRMCAKLVDMPPNVLNCTTYTDAALQVASRLKNVSTKVIRGKELEEQGFGGLYGVGKASEFPPALVVLSHTPEGKEGEKSICMVGKGIVYDTGGLSIKVPPGMCGMKTDMGGSAAVLWAFNSIVEQGGLDCPCHALLCIAENSVDERSARPDDIHIMLSGKSVELNNTDAEGRLVLGDGVFYAASTLNPKIIVDIATLTGAQLITTGKKHAAIFCNDERLEGLAMAAGKRTGDLVFPMLYCPEFHRDMFASQVADMKNSVSDRMNAQSSCAGQFIGNHLEEYLSSGGAWLHCDMAGPATVGDRATGYGVALLYDIVTNVRSVGL
jgi:probable aminopeptidase NPEPL1